MSTISPTRKKRKTQITGPLKRLNINEDNTSKRPKSENDEEDPLQAQRRKNFVTACEQVSFKEFRDYRRRLMLMFMPPCIKNNVVEKPDNKAPKKLLEHVEDLFITDIRANSWCEALEVCIMNITPTQHLSTKMLMEIVEITLNVHQDKYSEYTTAYILRKCQQIFAHHFSIHPPHLKKNYLTQFYLKFLTSPMDSKDKTFTNRSEFECNKGIVEYCIRRLEYELSSDSPEQSIIDMNKNTPEDMQDTLQGFHWQKEKFEIFECLDRKDRIERLMAVMESIVELLQFDLAIWLCKYGNHVEKHVNNQNIPLIGCILWPDYKVTGSPVPKSNKIIRIFILMVNLQCPEEHVDIMTMWLNLVFQYLYTWQVGSNTNYPNVGKHTERFVTEFYKVISVMPKDSIIRILSKVQPIFMKYLIGITHLKQILETKEDCILKMFIDFIKESKWEEFPASNSELDRSVIKKDGRKLRHLIKICAAWKMTDNKEELSYPKMSLETAEEEEVTRNHVVQMIYITYEAYLEAYSVRDVQESIDYFNERIVQNEDSSVNLSETVPELGSYSVTVDFVKKYRSIYQMLQELVVLFQNLKKDGLPDALKIFENLDLLEM